MIRYLLRIIRGLIICVANFSANTPSQVGAYQKKAPEKLIKKN